MFLSDIKEKLSLRSMLWVGASCAVLGSALWMHWRREKEIKRVSIVDVIGNTPLVFLPRLSLAAGCNIFVEFS